MSTAWFVGGLGFGDEGKGGVVDFLVRQTGARLVVRYNGGCQASHEVVLPDGRRHTFHQFGSGTLAGAHTYLGPEVVVDPVLLGREAAALAALGHGSPMGVLSVDPLCPVATPVHRAVNRRREVERGDARHGSCGLGVGEVRREIEAGLRPLRVGVICQSRDPARDALRQIRARAFEAAADVSPSLPSEAELWEWLDEARDVLLRTRVGAPLDLGGDVVFEGAQGALLDQWHGFHPHTSWGDCTFGGAERVLRMLDGQREVRRLGALRAYQTRHGPGPLPTYSEALTRLYAPPSGHNGPNPWQGGMRVGHFDAVLARYALAAVGGVDGLALTCLDQVERIGGWLGCDAYRTDAFRVTDLRPAFEEHAPGGQIWRQGQLSMALSSAEPVYESVGVDGVLPWVEAQLGAKAMITSAGPRAVEKHMVGVWAHA